MNFAVLCSGQGAQHAAMLDMLATHPNAAATIEQGEAQLGWHLRDILAQPDAIYQNAIAQPLICLSQLAVWNALKNDVPIPAAFCGYSVGELGAAACAGAMDAAELVRLASARAALMDQAAAANPGGLLAVQGLLRDELRALCDSHQAWIAIAISEEEFVIGGDENALDFVQKNCATRGAKTTRLKVGLASHTPLMKEAVAPFRSALMVAKINAPQIPLVAGVDAAWVLRREIMIEKLAVQLTHTIAWSDCLDTLYERGCRVFLELGPGRALARMTQTRFADVEARAVDDFRSLSGVAAWLSKQHLTASR
jgi:[acyl-carrier-protein] S-malonyltransferase